MKTTIQAPTTTMVLTHPPANTVEPPHSHQLASLGVLEWLQWASPTASAPLSQQSMPRREPSPAALGAPPSTGETEDPLRPEEMDSAIPAPMVTFMQMSPWVATPGDSPSLLHVTHPLLQPTVPKTPEAESM